MKHLSTLKQEIKREIDRYFKNAKHFLHWIHIDTGAGEHGNHYIEVRGELDYDEMENLADYLDKIIKKYDRDAYFEIEEPGIMRAYLDGLSEAQVLSDRLDSHLQNIKEGSDIEAQIDQKCKKLGFVKLKNLFGYQEYVYIGKYTHSIVYYPKTAEILYKIVEKQKRPYSYYDFKKSWKINNNIDYIFKEISKELEEYEQ